MPPMPPTYTPAPLLRTIVRFRCPYCGSGAVLRTMFTTHDRCAVCGYAFLRGNPAYFSGAIIINYLLGAGTALAAFLLFLAATWPSVPWSALRFLVPIAVVVSVVLLNPVSKMILMAVDVRMRPITEEELQLGSHGDDLWQSRR